MNPQIQEKDGKRYAKVCIPVVVDCGGDWIAFASSDGTKDEAMVEVLECAEERQLSSLRQIRFVYALVPIPSSADIDILVGEAETI